MGMVVLVAFVVLVMCWVAHTESDHISEKKLVRRMVEADIKAQRKRGDILSHRRGNYR